MRSGGVRSIVLLPLVARCLDTIDVCIWRMFVFMSVVVTVWGSGVMIIFVAAVVKDTVVLCLGVLKYVCISDAIGVMFSACVVTRGAVARVWDL